MATLNGNKIIEMHMIDGYLWLCVIYYLMSSFRNMACSIALHDCISLNSLIRRAQVFYIWIWCWKMKTKMKFVTVLTGRWLLSTSRMHDFTSKIWIFLPYILLLYVCHSHKVTELWKSMAISLLLYLLIEMWCPLINYQLSSQWDNEQALINSVLSTL